MAIVTQLETQKKNKSRVNVWLDGEFFCAVEAVSALSFGLKAGEEVSPDTLLAAIRHSESSSAFGKAADYLARGSKTRSAVEKYLAKKGYLEEIIAEVCDKLTNYGYIDDEAYCRAYVEQNSSSKGTRRLVSELVAKGIDREVSERCASAAADKAPDAARKLAAKYMKNKPRDAAILVKLQRYLLSRGFDYESVCSAVDTYRGES